MPESANSLKSSKYNEAIQQIQRLHAIWTRCHAYSVSGNLTKWNEMLDRGWIELAASSQKISPKKHKLNILAYNRFVKAVIKYKKKRNVLFQILMKKEIFLRGVQEQVGKGAAYMDPDQYGM